MLVQANNQGVAVFVWPFPCHSVCSDYPKLLVWDVEICLLCLDSVEAVYFGILLVQSLVPETGMTDFFDISIKGAVICGLWTVDD